MSQRSDKNHAFERLRLALAKTAGRERKLGRDGFFQLPERVQSRLAVLQGQARPKEQTLEAILAAEHMVKTYNEQLDDAFNLVAQLAGEAGRRAVGRRRRTNVALVTCGLLAIVLSGGLLYYRRALAAKANECRQAAGCQELGLCGAAIKFSPPPIEIQCQPSSPDDCSKSAGCRDNGRCQPMAGECAAGSDDDCSKTSHCKDVGLCSAAEGVCIANKPQDCRPTKGCTDKGLCTPIDNMCKAGSDADCRQSEVCKKQGACNEVEHECVKLDDIGGGGKEPAAEGKGR